MSLLRFRRPQGAGPGRCAPGGGGALAPPPSAGSGPRGAEELLRGFGRVPASAAPMAGAAVRLLRGNALVSALVAGALGDRDNLGLGGGVC